MGAKVALHNLWISSGEQLITLTPSDSLCVRVGVREAKSPTVDKLSHAIQMDAVEWRPKGGEETC